MSDTVGARGGAGVIESIRLALQGHHGEPLRSALTMLGILIGVAAVIILIAVGAGSRRGSRRTSSPDWARTR